MIDIFVKRGDELEEAYLWRIGTAKDSGLIDKTWSEIADMINKNYREDESEYRSESAYRKLYATAKKFKEAGIFANEPSEEANEFIELKAELKKEKQKLSDERRALNKIYRESARNEADLDRFERLIQESGRKSFPIISFPNSYSKNEMIICVSDFHMGIDADNYFGTYNASIALKRLNEYLLEIIKIKEVHEVSTAHIILLGDIISGNIHVTTQLENRENVVEQVQTAAELLSSFVYEISKHFASVDINSVAGNHSRTGLKDQVLRNERLDDIVPWYMEAKLSHLENVHFVQNFNYDSTIGVITVCDKEYWFVHGDYDSFSESGVSKLVMLIGHKPTAIFYGHFHHCSFDEISDIQIVRSGSFCGTVDDYSVSKRLGGKPSQMVCIADGDGIVNLYPVRLK